MLAISDEQWIALTIDGEKVWHRILISYLKVKAFKFDRFWVLRKDKNYILNLDSQVEIHYNCKVTTQSMIKCVNNQRRKYENCPSGS